jgi:transposase
VWWSRTAQPDLHSWAPSDEQLHLEEKAVTKTDPDPTAVACYGLLVRATATTPEQIWLRFATGQPVSALTTQFLEWCCERLAAQGKRALLMVWDNASWHKSQLVRSWIRSHNRQVKAEGGGVRIVACLLPSKSPWLNPIEPKWVHGKRAVLEPARVLSKQELADRVCAYYGCSQDAHLSIPEKVA